MSFLGIISNKKDFDIIRKKLENALPDEDIILINEKSLKNLQNIKFNALIINDELKLDKNNITILEKICKDIKYLIINYDRNNYLSILNNSKLHVVTYGLNHKCTITASSIKEDNLMIALQREISDRFGNIMDIGEKSIYPVKNLDIYGNMVIFILELLYNKNMSI